MDAEYLGPRNGDRAKNNLVQNQPYDESVEVSDGEDVPSTTNTPQAQPPPTHPHPPQPRPPPPQPPKEPPKGYGMVDGVKGVGMQGDIRFEEEVSEDGTETEESESDDNPNHPARRAYDPSDYEHLSVSSELKELFQHIKRYIPQPLELETQLRPFIPEYIPAIGDIDAFLKVTRPDGKTESIGMLVLDEPRAKQSDPTVLDLQLRTLTKQSTVKPVTVRSIEDPEKESKAMDNWIESIGEIHRQKPATTVHYTKNMPDVEALMQEWPAQFEEALKEFGLPTADLDCDLAQYTDIICALLDIPVYNSRIHSLHVLFSLYMEFKNSQHFKHEAPTVDIDPARPPSSNL